MNAWDVYAESTEIEARQRTRAQEFLDEADLHYNERCKALATLQAAGSSFPDLGLATGINGWKLQRMVARGRALIADQDVPVEA